MRRKMITAAAVATLFVFAQSANAKPIDVTGNGCQYENNVFNGPLYMGQYFKPTFSVLKKAKFVMWNYLGTGSRYFRVDLHDGTGAFLASSSSVAVEADASLDDAKRGAAVTFAFGGGVAVIPGETYQLRLVPESGDAIVSVCAGSSLYPDGYMFTDTVYFPNEDLEFGVAGGGKPK